MASLFYLCPMFRFKQFTVSQDKCAMKVNTDGVLLGAWAEVSGAKFILDIGTGTGVIALMMAQKNSETIIDAIDIDEDAFKQAKDNFKQSVWRDRLDATHSSLQDFSTAKKYDTIISNPPYFVDDFKTDNHQKNIAKHSVALTYEELLEGISRLLSATGKAFLVIPVFNFKMFEVLAEEEKLFVAKLTEVTAVKGKNPYLALIELSRLPVPRVFKQTIEIQDEKGNFTQQYKELTKEFYLKF